MRNVIVAVVGVSFALLAGACGGRLDQGAPAVGPVSATSHSATTAAVEPEPPSSAPPEGSTGIDPTASPGTPAEPDSPYTFDFTKPPDVSGPGTAEVASVDALATTDLKLPAAPKSVPGMTPTAVFTYWDGAGVQESFVDAKTGPFWFGQYTNPPESVAGMPDACVPCDAAESGRTTLASGDVAVVWVARPGAGPSSITWWHAGVVYLVMGPPTTLTRGVATDLANQIMAGT